MFAVGGLMLMVLMRSVKRRQDRVMETALRTNKIVTSMFPSNVRDRIIQDAEEQIVISRRQRLYDQIKSTKSSEEFDEKPEESADALETKGIFVTKPIADLFPETTVMMCDLVGFTAWSSKLIFQCHVCLARVQT
jgi:hypothetical protein